VVVAEALEIAANQTEAIFCTVDIDCCDPSAAPGTCSPSPGGLTSFELLESVFMVGQHPKVRHFDVMEVSPPLDVAQITAYTGAAVVTQFIGGVKKRKQGENS
jgi:arginase family enzyme